MIPVMIVDAYISTKPHQIPYCIGRDRGGRSYKPIYFNEKYVPSVGTRVYIERHGIGWRIKGLIITRDDLSGMGLGDRKIEADGDLILQAGNDINVHGNFCLGGLQIRDDGTLKPVSIDDVSAPNNSIYYSTTQNKLVYKDNNGIVNTLY